MKYTPIIGLEVHVELKTRSKMFCSCSSDYFGKEPNTHTCPVCLGLPGALPLPNRKAIDWCVMIGLALNCRINTFSKFDRKNYFYPDLPKGYQISQYDLPFGEHGYMLLANGKTISITRVHMEEDTGKLTHIRSIVRHPELARPERGRRVSGSPAPSTEMLKQVQHDNITLIDFNRSGVPLVEIVTEPDFENATEVKEYLQKLQQTVRYLDVSNTDMEKGEMRLEPNISLQSDEEKKKNKLPKYKVEVKNINSFKFVEKAINFELGRQREIIEKGETPTQETRGWNETKQKTFSQRSKEDAHDYRYFPEPDIPPITFTKMQIAALQKQMPELPDKKLERFIKDYGLSQYDAEILTRGRETVEFFEQAVLDAQNFDVTPKQIANMIINKKVDLAATTPADLIKTVKQATQTIQIDEEKLQRIINEVVAENRQAVEDYKKGKETAVMFLLGQVMRKLAVKADAKMVKQKIENLLK